MVLGRFSRLVCICKVRHWDHPKKVPAWSVFWPYDPARPCRPLAGFGLVLLMMKFMIMLLTMLMIMSMMKLMIVIAITNIIIQVDLTKWSMCNEKWSLSQAVSWRSRTTFLKYVSACSVGRKNILPKQHIVQWHIEWYPVESMWWEFLLVSHDEQDYNGCLLTLQTAFFIFLSSYPSILLSLYLSSYFRV